MPTRKPFKRVKPRLSDSDKKFIELVAAGEKRTAAFRQAYPQHARVKQYMDIVPETPTEDKRKIKQLISDSAKAKLQAQYIQDALVQYEDRMNELATLGLEVSEDLLRNGKSEFVKADLAKEFIRHKVGTPVARVISQDKKTIEFIWGRPDVRDDTSDIIDGEIVEEVE